MTSCVFKILQIILQIEILNLPRILLICVKIVFIIIIYKQRNNIVSKCRKEGYQFTVEKRFTLRNVLLGILVAVIFLLSGFLTAYLQDLYVKTGSLWFLLIYVIRYGLIGSLVTFIIIILVIILIEDKDWSFRNWFKTNWKKVLLITTGALVVISLVYNCFSVSKRFKVCVINGEEPSRHTYIFAILSDALSGKTETVELDLSKVDAGYENYSYRVKSGRYGSKTRTNHSYYISYINAEGKINTDRLCDSTSVTYIKGRKNLTDKVTDKVVIEYYINSGIVKTIDGYSPYDVKGLASAYEKLQNEYESVTEAEEERAKVEKAEKNRRFDVLYYDIMPYLPGMSLSEVKKIMADAEVPFDEELNVIYLSTKHFRVGDVAFFHLPTRTLYVVKDNASEEMLVVPMFDRTIPATEIIKMLEEAGITYECLGYDPDTVQYLNTYYCGPGTLVPKYNYTYTFHVR